MGTRMLLIEHRAFKLEAVVTIVTFDADRTKFRAKPYIHVYWMCGQLHMNRALIRTPPCSPFEVQIDY